MLLASAQYLHGSGNNMADHYSGEYNKKIEELIAIIDLIKLKLIVKHGRAVERYWDR